MIYNTREAPTAGKDHSPFTVIYWKSYCNSLLCEWKCICRKNDPTSAPLLSVKINGDNSNYNTMDDEEIKTPPPKDISPKLCTSSVINYQEEKNHENENDST